MCEIRNCQSQIDDAEHEIEMLEDRVRELESILMPSDAMFYELHKETPLFAIRKQDRYKQIKRIFDYFADDSNFCDGCVRNMIRHKIKSADTDPA